MSRKEFSFKKDEMRGDKYRISRYTTVLKALKEFSDDIWYCKKVSYTPIRDSPQALRKKQNFKGKISSNELVHEIENWSGPIKAYVTNEKSESQQVSVNFVNTGSHQTIYRYEFVIRTYNVVWN